MNIRGLRNNFPCTAIRLVVLGLLFTGCTTVQTERTSADQNLRTRTVRGASSEIFDLVARCVHREFPDGLVRSDPAVGEIVVTDYSVMRGDAVLNVTVIGWPDDRVEVNASATGLGADQQKKVIGKFLGDFDQAYADWVKERMIDRPAVE